MGFVFAKANALECLGDGVYSWCTFLLFWLWFINSMSRLFGVAHNVCRMLRNHRHIIPFRANVAILVRKIFEQSKNLKLFLRMALMEGSMKTGIKTFTARDHETKIMQIRERTPPLQPGRPVREEIIVPHRVCEVVEGKCYTPKARPRSEELAVQYPSDVESRNAAHSGRIHKDKKLPTTTSYGGTFHVSKDAVPMPSPCAGACKA